MFTTVLELFIGYIVELFLDIITDLNQKLMTKKLCQSYRKAGRPFGVQY